MSRDILLEIKNLTVSVKKDGKDFPIVKGVDIEVPRGKIVGIVGESGCGKSMTAKSINGILPRAARITGGSIIWHDKNGEERDLSSLSEKKLRTICGSEISMVFQEPMTSLNPMMRIGKQVEEVLLIHGLAKSKAEAKEKVIKMLDEVGIAEPELRYNSFPHELSGGMRQRVIIAMAVIAEPKLLIADEPTTALDVTIEAQILKLIRKMCEIHSMSVIIITHNMGVVSKICDDAYVMYMGRIMEHSTTERLFRRPVHPYTRGLLSSIPRIGEDKEYLETIPGNIPEIDKEIRGCEFCLRCSDDIQSCFFEKPEEKEIEEGHFVRCHSVEVLRGGSKVL